MSPLPVEIVPPRTAIREAHVSRYWFQTRPEGHCWTKAFPCKSHWINFVGSGCEKNRLFCVPAACTVHGFLVSNPVGVPAPVPVVPGCIRTPDCSGKTQDCLFWSQTIWEAQVSTRAFPIWSHSINLVLSACSPKKIRPACMFWAVQGLVIPSEPMLTIGLTRAVWLVHADAAWLYASPGGHWIMNIRFRGPHWMNFLLSVRRGKFTLFRGLLAQGLFAVCHWAEQSPKITALLSFFTSGSLSLAAVATNNPKQSRKTNFKKLIPAL